MVGVDEPVREGRLVPVAVDLDTDNPLRDVDLEGDCWRLRLAVPVVLPDKDGFCVVVAVGLSDPGEGVPNWLTVKLQVALTVPVVLAACDAVEVWVSDEDRLSILLWLEVKERDRDFDGEELMDTASDPDRVSVDEKVSVGIAVVVAVGVGVRLLVSVTARDAVDTVTESLAGVR